MFGSCLLDIFYLQYRLNNYSYILILIPMPPALRILFGIVSYKYDLPTLNYCSTLSLTHYLPPSYPPSLFYFCPPVPPAGGGGGFQTFQPGLALTLVAPSAGEGQTVGSVQACPPTVAPAHGQMKVGRPPCPPVAWASWAA